MQIYRNLLARIPAKYRPIPVIIGSLFVHVSIGTLYTIGNMNPYLASYFRKYDSNFVSYDQMTWFFSFMIIGQGSMIMFGGWLDKRFGPRIGAAVGCSMASAGIFMTYFTIQMSFWPCILTYGLLFGLGVGTAYGPPVFCAMKWFPNRRGLATGIIVCGFGSGAFIFNQVQTVYLNPHNAQPSVQIDGDKYFDDPEILKKLPKMILILGFVYVAMQIIGCLLLENPDPGYLQEISGKSSSDGDKVQSESKEKLQEQHNSQNERDIPPNKAFKTSTFILLWFAFLFGGQSTMTVISSYYKSFGQTFIYDDYFLALVGSFASVFNAGGRIFWGHFGDKYSFQSIGSILCCTYTFFMLTYPATAMAGKAMFLIWTCALFGSFCGQNSLYPMAIAKSFGASHVGVIYGFLWTSQVVGSVATAMISSKLKPLIGYNGLWFFDAGCIMLSFLLITLVAKTKYGRLHSTKTDHNPIDSEKQSSDSTEL